MSRLVKTFRPDIINGDVSTVIASNKTDAPFQTGDLLFDWHPIDIPTRANAVVDGIMFSYGEDGAAPVAGDIVLLIAKSNNGVAPTTLGAVNTLPAGGACPELPDVLMNMLKFEGSSNLQGKIELANYGGAFYSLSGQHASQRDGVWRIEPEVNNFGGVSTENRIYVAGIAGGALDFSTGVLVDGAITSDSATDITVKTVDPRRSFRVGDTVYLHDVDTALGTIASMDGTSVILNAAIAGGTDLADEDELVNAKPLTITLYFDDI